MLEDADCFSSCEYSSSTILDSSDIALAEGEVIFLDSSVMMLILDCCHQDYIKRLRST